MDLTVRILTTGYWPTQSRNNRCNLPATVREAYQCFQRFYLNKHNGRQLTLQANLGSADLIAMFFGRPKDVDDEDNNSDCRPTTTGVNKERKHTLQVSTCQMVILMLFNTKDSWTYEVNRNKKKKSNLIVFFSSLKRKFLKKQILLKKIFNVHYYPYRWVKLINGYFRKNRNVKRLNQPIDSLSMIRLHRNYFELKSIPLRLKSKPIPNDKKHEIKSMMIEDMLLTLLLSE